MGGESHYSSPVNTFNLNTQAFSRRVVGVVVAKRCGTLFRDKLKRGGSALESKCLLELHLTLPTAYLDQVCSVGQRLDNAV